MSVDIQTVEEIGHHAAPDTTSYARLTHLWEPARVQPPSGWFRTADEERRLAALHQLGLLDTPPEERFDRLTRLAAVLFDVPIVLVSLVDHER